MDTNYNMISDSMVLLYEGLMVQNVYFHSLYGKNTLKIQCIICKTYYLIETHQNVLKN